MPTIKNGQISLYCHFDKIIKGPGTGVQSPALSQKSRYLENKTLFFLRIKKVINYTSRATSLQKTVLQRR